jgi:hypothetical protein
MISMHMMMHTYGGGVGLIIPLLLGVGWQLQYA